MKVKELIEELQKFDPEYEVTDGHSAIYYVDCLPAYYDGCYVKLKQDHSLDPYWNIVGAKIESGGYKVVLRFLSADDLAYGDYAIENNDFFEYTEYSEKYRKGIEEATEESRKFSNELFQKNLNEVMDTIKTKKIIQTKSEIGKYYDMFYYDGEKKERMMTGHCDVVIKTELFEAIEMDDYFEWRLKKEG